MSCGNGRTLILASVVLLIWGAWGPLETAQADPVASHVDTVVTDLGGGSWLYEYTVFNDTGGFQPESSVSALVAPPHLHLIRDWELPWFGDAGVTSITSPRGWEYSIESIGVPNPGTGWAGVAEWQTPGDPMYAGPGSPYTTVDRVLHWYADEGAEIWPFDYRGGFSFVASYDETPAPYQASWLSVPARTGDPGFPMGTPNSPLTQGIPEPATLMLLALGAALSCGARRRRC